MRRFLARYKPVFPNYRKKAGDEKLFRQGVLPSWNGVLPASFLYAKDGRQIGHVFGEGTRDTYEAAIRALLTWGSTYSQSASSKSKPLVVLDTCCGGCRCSTPRAIASLILATARFRSRRPWGRLP